MARKVAPVRSQTGMVRRGATYYLRIRIPDDLSAVFYGGKKELKQSLRTTDKPEARDLVLEQAAKIHREFARQRLKLAHSSGSVPLKRVTYVDELWADRFCTRVLREWLETDDDERKAGLSPADLATKAKDANEMVEVLRDAAARGDITKVSGAISPTLHVFGIELDCDSGSHLRLAHRFLKMATRYALVLQQRNAGEMIETEMAAPEHAAMPLSPTSPGSDTIASLFADWKSAVDDRPLKTVNAYTAVVNEFTRFVKDAPASRIRRGDLIRFRDHLLKERDLGVKTVEKQLSFLCSIFQLGVDNERLRDNPALRIKVPRGKVVRHRRAPYSVNDLHQIVRSTIFRDGRRPRAGGREAAVWLPLLAMYTGARLEELGQLTPGDVQEHPEFGWYIEITDRHDGQHLKTESSRRRVPVHDELIKAGFLRYRADMLADGAVRLFPELKPDKHGIVTASWSKWWGRYARDTIGIADRSKVFHSLRHLFKDTCRDAGILEEVHDALTGHKRGGIGRHYGSGQYPLGPLFEAMRKFNYPGFELPVVVADKNATRKPVVVARRKSSRKASARTTAKKSRRSTTKRAA